MSLRTAIEVVARLADQEIIKKYAIAGAVAATNYIQPTLTEDLDVLVSVGDFDERGSGLILLTPIAARRAADKGACSKSRASGCNSAQSRPIEGFGEG